MLYHVRTLHLVLTTIDTYFGGHHEGTQQKQCADKLQNQHMTSWTKQDTKNNPIISLDHTNYVLYESRKVGLGTTVEYIERKFKTKA